MIHVADSVLTQARVRLWSMGQCSIDIGPTRVGPDAQMRFATLLFLTVERGKRVLRGDLVELLWPSASDARRRHSLRHLIYTLRLLGAPLTEGTQHIELPASSVDLDFEELLSGDPNSVANIQTFLPGYVPSFSTAYCEWVDRTRDEVHARLRPFLLTRLANLRARGKWTDMDRAARQCLQVDPLNEEATLALAEATALGGNKAVAVQILDRFLRDLESGPREIRVPANLLRKRITERLPEPYAGSANACFVGREELVTQLTTQLRESRLGRGGGWYVWGSAGIGKTRVALELIKLAALDGTNAIRIVCQPADAKTPLSVSWGIAHKLLELPGALGCAPSSRECLLSLTQGGLSLDTRPSQTGSDEAHDRLFHSRFRRAVIDLVGAVCDEKPLLLVVEDAQSLDQASGDVIRGDAHAQYMPQLVRHCDISRSPHVRLKSGWTDSRITDTPVAASLRRRIGSSFLCFVLRFPPGKRLDFLPARHQSCRRQSPLHPRARSTMG